MKIGYPIVIISRILDIATPLKDLSLFLLAPRQTGKSTLLRLLYPQSKFFDLLDPELFRDLNKAPSLLMELVNPKDRHPIIIDEIQKLPELLNVVHSLIVQHKAVHYILTGSSARKLRKQGQNLLGGRAYPLTLHPITSKEYLSFKGEGASLDALLQIGGLPIIQFYRIRWWAIY